MRFYLPNRREVESNIYDVGKRFRFGRTSYDELLLVVAIWTVHSRVAPLVRLVSDCVRASSSRHRESGPQCRNVELASQVQLLRVRPNQSVWQDHLAAAAQSRSEWSAHRRAPPRRSPP